MSCIKKNQHRIIWITINLVLSKSYNQGRIFKGARGLAEPPGPKKRKEKKKAPLVPRGKKKDFLFFIFLLLELCPTLPKS